MGFSPIFSFHYLSCNCHPILPQFFPNYHSIILHSQSISHPVFIPLFSIHSYPILSRSECALHGGYFPIHMRAEFSRCKRIYPKKRKKAKKAKKSKRATVEDT